MVMGISEAVLVMSLGKRKVHPVLFVGLEGTS